MPTIFISHSGGDDEWALALKDWLARESWDAFIDLSPERDIPAAHRWTSAFRDSTATSEAVLFLISKQWLASEVCLREYRLADRFSKFLIGLLIEEINLADLNLALTENCQLIKLTGEPAERFEIEHPRTLMQSSVRISEMGLSRLKLALQTAQIGTASEKAQTIFVSFSSRDKAEAVELVSQLEAASLKCWVSYRDVPHGEDFQDAIVTALEISSAMVLIFSRNADNSSEIKKELALASESGLFVLPVRIEDAVPTKGFKYQLATRQYIDLFRDRERNTALIIDALKKHLRTARSPA